VQRALERLETSEHGSRLNKIDVVMQDLRETIARGSDDAFSSLSMLVNMIILRI
jgi:hypothetical protein